MWLDEIRFRLPINPSAFDPPALAWSRLKVHLQLGDIPLTKDFVPISLLGKVLNSSLTCESNVGNGGPNLFTWRLPKPLFIPARELLRPTIYFEPPQTTDSFEPPEKVVTIIYCCRPLPRGTPTPKVLNIPWVTYFKPPNMRVASPLAPGGGATPDRTDQSTPADLYNPFDEDMHVQRFVGRLMHQDFGEEEGFMGLASADIDLETGVLKTGTLVSAQDSQNNILIRDRTPFAHVFDFLDRAWTVNCVLPPKGFYLFTIDRIWDTYIPLEGPANITVGISMVGHREVGLRK